VVYGFGNSAYNTDADLVVAFALPSAVAAAAAKKRDNPVIARRP